MLGLALFPLALYFLALAGIHVRRRSTVLTGRQDFMFLACALFGLVTLGPGRLLIPLSVLTYWHLLSWAFWAMFYFSAAYLTALFWQRPGLVIYHCPAEPFISKLVERTRQADPAAHKDGNVLFLPELGVQCSIERTAGQTGILRDTEAARNALRWRFFYDGVVVLCREIDVRAGRIAWYWGFLGLACLAVVAVSIFCEAPKLLESFVDHWMPWLGVEN